MSILNTASDGYYNTLIVLFRLTWQLGPSRSVKRDVLLEMCSPPDGQDGRLRQSLNRWTELGLFLQDDDGVSLSDKFCLEMIGKRTELETATQKLPFALRSLVFREENNQNLWKNEGTRSGDFTRGIAWLLGQDIYEVDLGSTDEMQRTESLQILDKESRIVQNDVRWNGLRAWGKYLKFLSQVDRHLVIDPTGAVREELPRVFSDTHELAAKQFLERLSTLLPVLDGGRYRVAVQDALNSEHWRPPSRSEFLSTSLSRALWRLDQSREITLERKADTGDVRVLQRSQQRQWQQFSHVRLNQRKRI